MVTLFIPLYSPVLHLVNVTLSAPLLASFSKKNNYGNNIWNTYGIIAMEYKERRPEKDKEDHTTFSD